MTPREIYEELRKIAPSVVFETTGNPDDSFVWDGDGPDPADEGMTACDIEVRAVAIINGELLEGFGYLGGHYVMPDDDVGDSDISGYLPQMLEEAANDLAEDIKRSVPSTAALQAKAVLTQLERAVSMLKAEMRTRWDIQQAQTTLD